MNQMWRMTQQMKGLTDELQQNLSVIIPVALKRKLHLDDEQDKIVEQENFVFEFPARCFCVDETTIE
jgi:hypothetical protein